MRQRPPVARKHGCTFLEGFTPEYIAWARMKSRCFYAGDSRYHSHGGRGITVCDRWRESFSHFLADMGAKPGPDYSVDRINNDGNYEPSNCRWATRKEQANNRRNNRFIEYRGERKTLQQWANELGMNRTTIAARLARGWSMERAVTSPLDRQRE